MKAGDPRLAGAIVYLDSNNNGILDQPGFGIDPDAYAPGQVLNNVVPSVTLSATATDNQTPLRVVASDALTRATTGQRVFGLEETTDWGSDQRFRFDFAAPAESVSIDVVGSSAVLNPDVILEAFDSEGQLVGSAGISDIGNGNSERLEIITSEKQISHAVARVTTVVGTVKYDNLRVDDIGGERATFTTDLGDYRFFNVPTGLAIVAQIPVEGYDQTTPSDSYRINVAPGLVRTNLDFANRTASIQGIVYEDLGEPGPFDPGHDRVIEGAGVYLDINRNSLPDATNLSILPNDFLVDQVVEHVSPLLTLSTADADNNPTDDKVVATTDALLSPDAKVFTHEENAAWSLDRRFRVNMHGLANRVEIQFHGAAAESEVGRLVTYSVTGEELASVETLPLDSGDSEVLAIERDHFDISYAVAYTSEPADGTGGSLRLTDLRVQVVGEPLAISDVFGEYEFKPLAGGVYDLRAVPSGDQTPTFPENEIHRISVLAGEVHEEVDFGSVPQNLPPIAKNDFATTQEDFVTAVGVLVNDRDPDGLLDEQSVDITQAPQHGTAEVDAAGFINYTPDPDFSGRDTLLYTVQDELGAVSNSAIVTIQVNPVNDAPIAEDDDVSVLGSISTPFDVLGNDTDVDSLIAPSTINIVNHPASGTVVVDAVTGIITYTPLLAAATDAFTYTVEDSQGAVSNEATVTINRVSEGIPPVAVDDLTTAFEGTATQVTVTDNDTDADGTINESSVFIVAFPQNGSVRVGIDGLVNYQPNLGFIGTDVFSYRVQDNSGLVSNSANVRVSTTERDFPYQNPIHNLDVDSNGFVSPRDVLLIIREIDDRHVSDPDTGEITVVLTPGAQPSGYFDVDGDGFIVARDVLSVVIHLNEISSASAEPPELDSAQNYATAAAAVFALRFDPWDDEEE